MVRDKTHNKTEEKQKTVYIYIYKKENITKNPPKLMPILTWCYWNGEWFQSISKKKKRLILTCWTTELLFSGRRENRA